MYSEIIKTILDVFIILLISQAFYNMYMYIYVCKIYIYYSWE